MHVSYHDDDDGATVSIHQGEWAFCAEREDEHVTLHIRNRCRGVFADIEVQLSCQDYDRLLCELSRVECGPRECDECEERETEIVKVIVFDQDDCDDERERPKPKTRTARKN